MTDISKTLIRQFWNENHETMTWIDMAKALGISPQRLAQALREIGIADPRVAGGVDKAVGHSGLDAS